MKNKLEMAAEECATVNIHAMYGPNAASQISDNIEYDIIVESFITGAQWQLENMWIPIEEGSPETEDDVLVLIVANGRTFAMTNKFVDRNLFAVPTCLDWKVVAWMEIPKFTKRK